MTAQPAMHPDPDAVICAALSEFEHAVIEARAHGDKIEQYLAATLAGIRSHVAIRDDMKLTVEQFRRNLDQLPSAHFTDAQLDELSRNLVRSCQVWAGSLVKAANLKSAAVAVSALVIMAMLSFFGGWLYRGSPPDFTCQAERGGQVCWYWQTPAAEPEIAPPPAEHSSLPASKTTLPKAK